MPDDALSLLPERLELPRGRAALPEREVEASQRGRILQAVCDEVAAAGYARTTVTGITRRARVSRTTFYQCFSDKEEAFASAHETISEQLVQFIRDQAMRTPDSAWEERIELGVRGLMACLEARPTFARSFLVEVHVAGDRVRRQRDLVVERHARSLARVATLAAAAGAEVRVPTELEVIGAIGATEELVSRQIRATDPRRRLRLSSVVPPVVAIHSALLRPV
ncbi:MULTISPECIES: TetR/AcrR family transcriptional regulator [Aeromicrobium]|uniref:TetR/AcrR family transcriptional regulator n=1 Tax=Aeromicrobium TaxID=2040 RepID=UPI0025801E2C|nr:MULTISPECIES: TetR/AcrR family transcriptional regulator [Aeromicrobium]